MTTDKIEDHNKYVYRLYGDTVHVELPCEMRNGRWGEEYGPIQKSFRKLNASVKNIIISGLYLKWVDPLPMLSLLISIAELQGEKEIFFFIPNRNNIKEEQKKVFEFLEKEGFFDVMQKYKVYILEVDDNGQTNINDQEEVLIRRTKDTISWIHNNLKGFVYFSNCTIVEATIEDLRIYHDGKKIDEHIENLLKSVKHKLSNYINQSQINDIMWKTELFLKETINNVYEHAYKEDSPKFVGYYIRHRNGLADNTLPAKSRESIKDVFFSETKDLDRLVTKFPMHASNFLEILVIDAGIGLSEHYTSKRKHVRKSFREVWRETIGLGNRGVDKEFNTEFGGLYTLGKILDKEYLLGRDYDYWIGDVLPIDLVNASYLSVRSDQDKEKYIEGLSLISRIEIFKPMDESKDWILNDNSKKCFGNVLKEEKSIYEKYYDCNNYKDIASTLFKFVDNRFDQSSLKDIDYFRTNEDVKFLFYLPKAQVSKNEIYDYINRITNLVENNIDSKTIIIADIPVNECGLYQQALNNARFSGVYNLSVEKIIMISQRLSVYVLTKDGNTYKYNKEETNNYIDRNIPNIFSPHKSLFHALEWLKTHDSTLTWEYINKKNEIEGFYINQDIHWYRDNKEVQIHGYLDFEKTLTDPFLKKIYHNVLRRTLCLASGDGCSYIADDPLMTGLADYMNNLFYNKNSINGNPPVALGSIYVSGSSQTPHVTNINLYLHQGQANDLRDINKQVFHLLLWHDNHLFSSPSKNSNYKRVGSTYAIAPFGWRYFPIPRYRAKVTPNNIDISNKLFFKKEEMENVIFKQAYKCSPKDTYNYWQGRNGLFMGISHVDYETKHDILNINFPFIVKESFLQESDLACYLLGEIMAAFHLDENTINFHGKDKLKRNVRDYIKNEEEKYKKHKCSFLIYPYHSNTEHIVDVIKEYVKDIKIIPLIPLNKERNGTSFQPSPRTIEMLRKVIEDLRGDTNNEINALLLDDAIIDGKTQEEIKHVMYGLGVDHIMSVFILERRRIPFNTSDNRKSSAFWRLDIPRLGSKYSCPLCASINSISDFSSQLISENAYKRVQEWKLSWEARTVNTLERTQSLTPIKLQLNNPKKRFGIYIEGDDCKQCGGDENKIEIHSSLGLTLYMGELISITSRDDKMLRTCEDDKNSLDKYTILEMLCTNLLLYGKTITRNVREKLVAQIIKQTYSITECNNHTSFAALVLMTQEDDVLANLKSIYDENLKSNIKPNYDILILLSYMTQRNKKLFFNMEEPLKLIRTSMIEDKAYRLFHSELFTGNGKTHDRPIKKLIDNITDPRPYLRTAEDAMDCLYYALDHIHDWNLSDWDKNNIINVCEAKHAIKDTKESINKLDWEDLNADSIACVKSAESLMKKLSMIHDRLYMPLNIINDSKDYEDIFRLKDRISLWNDEFDIGFFKFNRKNEGESHNIEKWMIWDKTVDDEIYYLFKNAFVHSKQKKIGIKDKHVIWVTIEYADDLNKMILKIYNKTTPGINADYIRKESAKKTRYGKTRLKEELKIDVDWHDFTGLQEKDLIETRITFTLI